MPVKSSVFANESERELFDAISSMWGDRFSIYPSLPFSALFEIPAIPLKHSEREFLFKTNVDYTLCTKRGRPLVSIEFDGLGHGFSRHGTYVQMHECRDPARFWKLNLKVRIATEAGYPFVVVSFDEKTLIGQNTRLTIVDGIIGQVLAKKHFERRLKLLVSDNWQAIESASPEWRDEILQDLVTDAETLAELEWDPIARAAADHQGRLIERGLLLRHSFERFHEPALPGLPLCTFYSPKFLEALKARAAAMERSIWIGCTATIEMPKQVVGATVRMRNIEHAGVQPRALVENMAMLVACKRAEQMAT